MLIQGATLLYILRGTGTRLSLVVPIGHTQDMVERFQYAVMDMRTPKVAPKELQG